MKAWLGRLDPLVLFLAAGLALYLLIDALGLSRGDQRLIAIDEAQLAAFAAGEGGQDLEAMSRDERRTMVDRYIREEALYREARALGLDRGDTAIRRRLVQSLRFSLQGDEAEAEADPGDAELRDFLAAHRDRYVESAKVSFSHVFFDAGRRGKAGALEVARQTLPLAATGDWLALGDRYAYQRSQIDVTRDALAAELGGEAAGRIFVMKQGDGWQGPIESRLGVHLVRIDRRSAGRGPDFATVRAGLLADWRQDQREKRLERAIDGIVEDYAVKLSPELERQLQ